MNVLRQLIVFIALLNSPAMLGQNLVEDRATGPTAPLIDVSEEMTLGLINLAAPRPAPRTNREALRIVARLDRHVNEFFDGAPWMPFHHTLGISGYEACFNHPDEMFYALSLALPFLPTNTAAKAKLFLAQRLSELPPYSIDGFDNKSGHPREAYDVRTSLRVSGRGKARSAFGVCAFAAFTDAVADTNLARAHWPAIKQRIDPLLKTDYRFDITKKNYAHDEAEMLNGNLAALIAAVRLARTNNDAATEHEAIARATQLLKLRVNLERTNPRILETTDSATKHLHITKLARFCDLTPEIGAAVGTLTDGCGSAHLRNFREARNGWYLAFGDRMIGGENYTNPPHFSRALFAGAVFVEQLAPEQIASFIDVPWCKADFYFIEKCALALRVLR